MRCFLKGVAGGITLLVLWFLLSVSYADYSARAETGAWLGDVQPIRQEIESRIKTQKTLAHVGANIQRPTFSSKQPDFFEVTDSGQILIRGGKDGQMVVLTPTIEGSEVAWRCVGGPKADVPPQCRA